MPGERRASRRVPSGERKRAGERFWGWREVSDDPYAPYLGGNLPLIWRRSLGRYMLQDGARHTHLMLEVNDVSWMNWTYEA